MLDAFRACVESRLDMENDSTPATVRAFEAAAARLDEAIFQVYGLSQAERAFLSSGL